MADFKSDLIKRTEEVEKIIYERLPKEEGWQKNLIEAMNYSVTAGGKRLRPMLLQETARLFGYEGEDVPPFMAAIEIIHTYSLVHDDLPAIDNDDYRRGKLTTHKKYGHATGILAGDGLLNYAYEICSEAIVKSVCPDRAAKALMVLSKKAGIYGMVGGQTVDVEYTDKPMPPEVLQFVHELKTGALIQAAMMAGAFLAGAKEDEIEKIEKIALMTGLAFQIQDDILDVTSTTEVLGKPVFSDKKNNKTTYVTILGLEGARQKVKEYSDSAVALLNELNYKNKFLQDLLISLIHREK
ncbi:MAG: polyprenyl synthetase family protein [Lachnospiraceae bacterium]|jgi:Geranylgeranyl pyrophosphate synthase|nr:polyprenyl synthetase family protein [Lachnospiraceae bacterium]